MESVKKYHVGDSGLVEGEALGRITVYLAADFERLSSWRDADQKKIVALQNEATAYRNEAEHGRLAFDRVTAEREALQLLLNERGEQVHSLEQRRYAEQQARELSGLSAEAFSVLQGMVEHCLNVRACMGMDEGFKDFDTEEEHDFVKELRAFLSSQSAPADKDEECVHDFRMFSSECAKCGAWWIPGKDYAPADKGDDHE